MKGEYGRTNKGKILRFAWVVNEKNEKLGYILKFINGRPVKHYLENDEEIVKHSKNIKELIEIGDYVNGYSIDNIINGVLVHRANGIDRSGCLVPIVQYENDIKSILTKEKFESESYEVEEM